MGVPTSEVGYTSAMPRSEDHEVHKDTSILPNVRGATTSIPVLILKSYRIKFWSVQDMEGEESALLALSIAHSLVC